MSKLEPGWWTDKDDPEIFLMIVLFLCVMVVGWSFLHVTTELIQVAYDVHIMEDYPQ